MSHVNGMKVRVDMSQIDAEAVVNRMQKHFKPHPWHGIKATVDGSNELVNAFIEIVPSDSVKYEVDKATGYLMVDRPQKFSNVMPCLYGFVPQTYCGDHVAAHAMQKLSRTGIKGDGDPIDICVLTDADINQGDLLLHARPIGGFRMIDDGEADDKIIAVLKDDPVYEQWNDVSECPQKVIDRMKHYFLTYKQIPGAGQKIEVEIAAIYGREEALQVLEKSRLDYAENFAD